MAIPAIKLGEGIYLQPSFNGRILLRIQDILYEADENVPPSHYPEMAKEKKRDARTVVTKCLIHEYGPNRRRWPAVARLFVENTPSDNSSQ